ELRILNPARSPPPHKDEVAAGVLDPGAPATRGGQSDRCSSCQQALRDHASLAAETGAPSHNYHHSMVLADQPPPVLYFSAVSPLARQPATCFFREFFRPRPTPAAV
ncbi:MAG TPA: hypothetical protein VF493_22345, partial [Terriglobales bacterium]